MKQPYPCVTCGGSGMAADDYDDVCCGNYLATGECCAALYGTANIVRVPIEQPCPHCSGTGVQTPEDPEQGIDRVVIDPQY